MRTIVKIDEEIPSTGLRQWPIQIKLVPTNASYFEDADLLIAADCSAFAHADFHAEYMQEKITLIGCPKLDSVDYKEKLAAIIVENAIRSINVVSIAVPCCSLLEDAVKNAIVASEKNIPLETTALQIP